MLNINTLEYHSVGKTKNNDVVIDLYSFKCLFNQQYIVEVEHHKDFIFIIKYFKKNHSNSKHRYSLLNVKSFWKKPDNAKNFLAILKTVTNIMLSTYYKEDKSSFGFMGAPTIKECSELNKKNINEDGTVNFTKRYNIYSLFVKRYFSPAQFEHIEIKSSSCYMLRNVKNTDLSKEKVECFFNNYINTYC